MALSLHIQSEQKLNLKPSSSQNSFILFGDLNSEPTESTVRDFCQIYGCKNLIKGST